MIGILGGTFDPVHFGHLRLAVEMYQDLGLQEVRLVPCRIPPHRNAPQASPEQRLAMLRLAIEHELGLRVDQRELQRDGPSYMVDTLQSLRDELGPDTPLSLILGMDAFDDIDTWHRWEELIQLAHFIVIQRPGVVPHAGKAAGVLLSRYQVERAQMPGGRAGGRILLWTATQLDISATRIRSLVAAEKSVRYLLPDRVREYMLHEGLYHRSSEGECSPKN